MKDVVIKHKGKPFTVGLIDEARYFQQNVRGAHYAPVYDSRSFDYLAYRLMKRGRNYFDNRIVIAGPPRTGKSTIAVTWAKRIDPDFSIDNVAFRLEDFRKRIADLPNADPENGVFPIAILDESGVDLYAKDWATRMVKDMVKVFGICGKKRLTMFLVLPHRNLLTKDMRDEMHFWVNTIVEDELRGYAEVRESKPSPWNAPYWKPLFGLVFEEQTGEWWDAYEKKKDDFIDHFTRQDPVVIPRRVELLTKQRDAAIKELRRIPGYTLKKIEEVTGVDDACVHRIASGKRTNPTEHRGATLERT